MAESQSSDILLDSPLVRVYDVVCTTPHSGYGTSMLNRVVQIGIPRRGFYFLEREGETSVIDTNTALILGQDDEYRVAHPSGDGDEGTVFAFGPDLVEDAIGSGDGRVGRLGARDQLAVGALSHALRGGRLDRLEAEDWALLLLGSIAHGFADLGSERSPGPGQRLRIQRARALLAGSPTDHWDLGALGRAIGCSPFHLSREFRAITGQTVSRYLLRLRLGLALDRLAAGQSDMAALAVDLGFSHHSHFSSRFRAVFGITPTKARDMLTSRSLESLRAAARS